MAIAIREFKPQHNADIMNAIRNRASSDYQRRIPNASKARFKETAQEIWDYAPHRNEFIDALVNRIGLVIARNNSWTNPLSKFKQGMLTNGDTIEEIMVGLAEANTYEHDRDYLEKSIFGQERPEVQSRFHKINREEFYKITIKEFALQRAFLTDTGISDFIVKLMDAPSTSDNWDEFLHTTRLFAEYENNGGFFKVNIPEISAAGSTEADSKYALRRMHETAGNLGFLSRQYNAARMPVTAKPEDLELFITPEANAAMNVEALAGAFNIDRSEFDARKTIIPKQYFGIEGAEAILTTRDFFVIADTRFETTSAPNPVGLYTNYFLHHHQVISASPFVPAILFTTEPGTVIEIADTPVTGVEPVQVMNRDEEVVEDVERGDLYRVTGEAVTDPEGGFNTAVVLELSGAESSLTYLTQTGHLAVPLNESATELTITATSTEDSEFSAAATVTVSGDMITVNPLEVHTDSDNDGVFEVTPTEPAFDADTATITIPTVTGVQYSVAGVTATNGSEHVIEDATTVTAAARAGYALADGATASWEFTV